MEEVDMRIAQLAPPYETVPPTCYGGTERVVATLTEELVRRGHDVTLFASGDSCTSARLVPIVDHALWHHPEYEDFAPFSAIALGKLAAEAARFDVVHNHLDYMGFPLARILPCPVVSTLHGRLDLPELVPCFEEFRDVPLVSISDAQRQPLPDAGWVRTVYNGIDLSHFHFQPTGGDYLVFLGRMTPDKRPDRAIEIARDLGQRLVMAAKVDPVDQAYFDHAIAPLIRDSSLVEFVGEVTEQEKDVLLGGAYAYLFPIDWPEPFGLTMIEAMATGTPVVAYRAGSVPEIIVDGVTGFVCDSFRDMVEAVPKVASLSRAACRDHVAHRFSAEQMADGYERAYAAVLDQSGPPDDGAALRGRALVTLGGRPFFA